MRESPYVGSADAARYLGYTIQHVRRLVKDNRLEGVKIGRDWLVLRSSMEALAARREYLSLSFETNPNRRGAPSDA